MEIIMKYNMLIKQILLYIAVAITSFAAVTTICYRCDYNRIYNYYSNNLYQQATEISVEYGTDFLASNRMPAIRTNLNILSHLNNTRIMFIEPEGKVLLDTGYTHKASKEDCLYEVEDFDYGSLNGEHSHLGNFFGLFNENMLSVYSPITSDFSIYLIVFRALLYIHGPYIHIFLTIKGKKTMKTTINKKLRGIAAALLLIGLVPSNMMAQDKVEASVGADLVSGYIWRGQDLGGVSIQPSLGISYKGLSLGAWGSVGFESTDTKEFDLTLGYSIGGFSVSVTDYWFNTQVETGIDDDGETIFATNKYFKYGAHSTAHVFEAQVGYDFGPLAVNWYTNFAGADGVKENGKRAYSSYLALSAPFKLGGLDWTVDLGMVPWETTFYNGYTSGFCVSDVSLGASKDIKITDSFSVPAFAKVSVNPRTEGAYFAFGLSF